MPKTRMPAGMATVGAWLLLSGTAAANPFATYGMTENYTVDNLPSGHVAIDMRTVLTTPDQLSLPGLGVIWNVMDGFEVGVVDSLQWSGIGKPGWNSGPGALNPWVKLSLPVPGVKLGVLAAAEIPADGSPVVAGAELLYQTPTPLVADLCINLGYANTPTFTAPLYYLDATGTQPLNDWLDVVLELSALSLNLTQRLGLQAALSPQWDADVSLAVLENAATGQVSLSPQIGATVTF